MRDRRSLTQSGRCEEGTWSRSMPQRCATTSGGSGPSYRGDRVDGVMSSCWSDWTNRRSSSVVSSLMSRSSSLRMRMRSRRTCCRVGRLLISQESVDEPGCRCPEQEARDGDDDHLAELHVVPCAMRRSLAMRPAEVGAQTRTRPLLSTSCSSPVSTSSSHRRRTDSRWL